MGRDIHESMRPLDPHTQPPKATLTIPQSFAAAMSSLPFNSSTQVTQLSCSLLVGVAVLVTCIVLGAAWIAFAAFAMPRTAAATRPPPPTCPICLAVVVRDTPGDPDQAITLLCGHFFCPACIRQYVETKVRKRHVESGHLVCPVISCRCSVMDYDLRRILADESYQYYQRTLHRVRAEKHPLAKWCPRTNCGGLVVSAKASDTTFRCPSCQTVWCCHCRGPAHFLSFQCRDKPSEDASFVQWVRSVGGSRAVRPCPQCGVQIWKNAGCDHVTCTRCRHRFRWF